MSAIEVYKERTEEQALSDLRADLAGTWGGDVEVKGGGVQATIDLSGVIEDVLDEYERRREEAKAKAVRR